MEMGKITVENEIKTFGKMDHPNIGWIHLNIKTMPKILRYVITSKLLLSNVRFSASFGRLEESTHPFKLKCNFETLCSSINML